MINQRFFSKKKEFFTLKEVLAITDSKVVNDCDLDKKIFGVATIDKAGENDISFLYNSSYLEKFSHSQAGFCFVEEKFLSKAPKNMITLVSPNAYFAYAKFLDSFYFDKKIRNNASDQNPIIGENTFVADGAVIGKNVVIGKNCYIGANSVIGDNCQIGDNCTINALVVISYCLMGNNVIVHNGAKIGQDGFGFAHNNGRLQKILQLGIVEINDDVEIGANTCIDRGAIANTVIGKQVKIDNLVQIAHNVTIGEGTVIAGCAAIAGSTKIGRFVQIGGSSNIAGHINIGDGVKMAAVSGVIRDVEPMQVIGGAPALPIKEWHRMNVKLIQMSKRDKKDGDY